MQISNVLVVRSSHVCRLLNNEVMVKQPASHLFYFYSQYHDVFVAVFMGHRTQETDPNAAVPKTQTTL